jgi:DNA repair exonuclease SbcCD nuclease subunit
MTDPTSFREEESKTRPEPASLRDLGKGSQPIAPTGGQPPTSIFKILVIGDPHFKTDNAIETDLMTSKLIDLVLQEQPDFTVVLGDTLHTHDLVRLDPLCRATDFFQKLRDVSHHLYILIGNHDRPNNACYLTSDHPFNSLKDWRQTTVIDRVQTRRHLVKSIGKDVAFTFVPYVPVGKFSQALLTAGLSLDPDLDTASIHLKQMTTVFAHQEFKGAKMGAIVSESGDPWPMGAPLCISGHVHDFDELSTNLIYIGTPIQHGYADKPDKTVSLLHFKLPTSVDDADPSSLSQDLVQLQLQRHQRISLGIPPKIHIRLTPQQLTVYTPPVNSHVKITVEGDPDVIRQVLALDHVKSLSQTHGIKIVILDTRRSGDFKDYGQTSKTQGSTPFRVRLHNALSLETPEVQLEFTRLFGQTTHISASNSGKMGLVSVPSGAPVLESTTLCGGTPRWSFVHEGPSTPIKAPSFSLKIPPKLDVSVGPKSR